MQRYSVLQNYSLLFVLALAVLFPSARSAQAQDFPEAPVLYEIIGLSIPLIERGRSRGVIRMDAWLEITPETNVSRMDANEVRLRNSIVSRVGSALNARPSGSAEIDLDFITTQILAECSRLFGEGQVVGVLFGRVIIRNS